MIKNVLEPQKSSYQEIMQFAFSQKASLIVAGIQGYSGKT